MQYKVQIFWINPSEERSYWGVYNDMIEDWRGLSWLKNLALWSISFYWGGLIINNKIVGLLIEMDYSYRNSSEEGLTVDIWQGHTARKPPSMNGIGMSRVSGNNQAANWGRLFGQWWRTKRSLLWIGIPVRKDLLCIKVKIVRWLIEMSYLETIRLLTEEDCLTWWRTKRSLSWTRTCCEKAPQHIWYKEVRTLNEADYLKDQIADWGRSLELQYQTTAWDLKSTKPSEEELTVDIWKGRTARKPPSINSIGCWEYPIIKWHQICQEYEMCYQQHGMLRVQNPVRKDPLWIF